MNEHAPLLSGVTVKTPAKLGPEIVTTFAHVLDVSVNDPEYIPSLAVRVWASDAPVLLNASDVELTISKPGAGLGLDVGLAVGVALGTAMEVGVARGTAVGVGVAVGVAVAAVCDGVGDGIVDGRACGVSTEYPLLQPAASSAAVPSADPPHLRIRLRIVSSPQRDQRSRSRSR